MFYYPCGEDRRTRPYTQSKLHLSFESPPSSLSPPFPKVPTSHCFSNSHKVTGTELIDCECPCQVKSNLIQRERKERTETQPAVPPRPTEEVGKRLKLLLLTVCQMFYISLLRLSVTSPQELKGTGLHGRLKKRETDDNQVWFTPVMFIFGCVLSIVRSEFN